jgi:hypothetical protein
MPCFLHAISNIRHFFLSDFQLRMPYLIAHTDPPPTPSLLFWQVPPMG